MKIFIVGIAGGTGSRTARLLAQQQNSVSGLYRHSEQIDAIRELGARGILGDISTMSERELAAAIAENDAIVFSAGAGEHDDEPMIDTIDEGGVRKTIAACRLAGVSRLLLVSVFPEAWREKCLGPQFEHYMSAKKRADAALVRSELDWIILRPSALQDVSGTGRIDLSAAEIHGTIARDDLAATIVSLLHTPRLSKQILEVTAGNHPIDEAVSAL